MLLKSKKSEIVQHGAAISDSNQACKFALLCNLILFHSYQPCSYHLTSHGLYQWNDLWKWGGEVWTQVVQRVLNFFLHCPCSLPRVSRLQLLISIQQLRVTASSECPSNRDTAYVPGRPALLTVMLWGSRAYVRNLSRTRHPGVCKNPLKNPSHWHLQQSMTSVPNNCSPLYWPLY